MFLLSQLGTRLSCSCKQTPHHHCGPDEAGVCFPPRTAPGWEAEGGGCLCPLLHAHVLLWVPTLLPPPPITLKGRDRKQCVSLGHATTLSCSGLGKCRQPQAHGDSAIKEERLHWAAGSRSSAVPPDITFLRALYSQAWASV